MLRGVFLGRPHEVDWFLHGMAAVFPDAHAHFVGFLPEAERGDMLGAYLRRLTDPDPVGAHAGGARLVGLRGLLQHAAAEPGDGHVASRRTARRWAWRGSRRTTSPTTCSCRRRGCSARMDRIGHIPAEIVQGRYDMICPARTAFELAAAWPAARLTIVPDAGHSALEPGIRRALVAAVERFRHGR